MGLRDESWGTEQATVRDLLGSLSHLLQGALSDDLGQTSPHSFFLIALTALWHPSLYVSGEQGRTVFL